MPDINDGVLIGLDQYEEMIRDWTVVKLDPTRLLEPVVVPESVTGLYSEEMDCVRFEREDDAILFRLSTDR